jgi:predicted lysophospholipase L1 biosynthesis ABC-type transport system permease subunit
MKRKEEDYMQDLREIRSIMERSTKFLSLSGISGVLAGLYALAGAYLAFGIFKDLEELVYGAPAEQVWDLLLIGFTVLVLAIGTAILFSVKKAKKRGEKLWNSAAKRMLVNMAVPLVTGGILVLVFLFKGLILLMAPLTLIFYGLALYNASKFTFSDVKYFGFVQVVLGLLAVSFTEYSLLFWAIGFGVMHIIYGIYVNYKYER